jgi:hypothetical protein
MSTLFLFCVLVGGTFLVCQFVMTLIGLGHSDAGADLSHAPADSLVPAGDIAHEVPHNGVGGDVSLAHEHSHGHGHGHGSSWLFGIISFRTLTAAATFFGLAGMTAQSGGASLLVQLLIAIASGGVAMLGVHWLMRTLFRLGQNATLELTSAIGKTATVSVSIPGGRSGQGKVRLTVQGRLEELAAVALTGEALARGSQVIVVDVIRGNVLEVTPLPETN